jgi:hypothetical protein
LFFCGYADGAANNAAAHSQLQQQPLSAALPQLTSFRLLGVISNDALCAGLEPVAEQLTHLGWTARGPISFDAWALLPKLNKLRRLDLGCIVDDAVMQALLTHLPSLTHVTVYGCELQVSHTHRTDRSWQELRVGAHLLIASLALLPLRCIQRLVFDDLRQSDIIYDLPNPHDLAATPLLLTETSQLPAALAAATDCTISCENMRYYRRTSGFSVYCSVREMPALLPLLVRVRGMHDLKLSTRESDELTPAAVTALGALLEAQRCCTALHLCHTSIHPSAQLLPALANTAVSDLHVQLSRSPTEAELVMWCAGSEVVSRPLNMTVCGGGMACVSEGQLQNVRSAMAAAGSGVHLKVPMP